MVQKRSRTFISELAVLSVHTVRIKKWVNMISRVVDEDFQHLQSNPRETVFLSFSITLIHFDPYAIALCTLGFQP